jgi:hypothetical protein
MADRHGLPTQPEVIAELGPGDSIGIGLAALLSGASKYYALDVIEYANLKGNLTIFEELVSLFRARTPIPDEEEFPGVWPRLISHEFPSKLLPDERLQESLREDRLRSIRNAIAERGATGDSGIQVRYFVPWHDPATVKPESVDMVFSQAVLEHVVELRATYLAMRAWLKPGGFMSHTIDFGSHATAKAWNGHWGYSDLLWRLIRGRGSFLINRQPHATHLQIMKETGFEVLCDLQDQTSEGLTRSQLAERFANLSDHDLHTRLTFVVARKPTAG